MGQLRERDGETARSARGARRARRPPLASLSSGGRIGERTTRRHPAEWEKQASVWLSWPHNEKEWGKKRLPKIKEFYVKLIKIILQFQDVNLILADEELLGDVKTLRATPLRKIIIPNNDIWIRDYGPFFIERKGVIARKHEVLTKQSPDVTRNEIASVAALPRNDVLIVDFEFNAWGDKFPPWDLDNNVPKQIALYKGCEIESYPIILEGGAVEFSGNGLLMTTEQCLLNKNRNKNIKKDQFEKILKSAFNVQDVIWLKSGLHGDHTDGHTDNVARFISEKKILLCTTKNKKDKNYETLQENLKCLKKQKLELVEIPLPEEYDVASYANFIFVNGGIIVPTFNCDADEIALDIFKKLFPKRKIIGIDCFLLVQEGGGLHCMTKQEPLCFS